MAPLSTSSYLNLSSSFYSFEKAAPLALGEIVVFNDELFSQMGASEKEVVKGVLLGAEREDSPQTFAMAYSGHQFGQFNPHLGDGRALFLGEFRTSQGVFDLHLKGSGRTKYSRRGDGKSALGPALREYLVSEYMFHLGIPTTRSLAVTKTGETVLRQEGEIQGGVLARVAKGHIRIGSFEYAYHFIGDGGVRELADFVISKFYPHLQNHETKYLAFFREFAENYLTLVSRWMGVGFIHGVMNTDNAAISGETIDYGPCAFLDEFNFQKVFSYIDQQGRYRYAHQPRIAIWNLSVLGSTLIDLVDEDKASAQKKLETVLSEVANGYSGKQKNIFSNKLGLESCDSELVDDWVTTLEKYHLDFTQSFYYLTRSVSENKLHSHFSTHSEFVELFQRLLEKNPNIDLMRKSNPSLIPRNHLIEEVIEKAYQGSLEEFYQMLEGIKNPFKENAEVDKYFAAPQTHERVKNTFCGT